MSPNVSLDVIGAMLRQIQADQREDRLARELLQGQLARLQARMISREDLADLVRVFSRELGRWDGRFDRWEERFDRWDESFDRIDSSLRRSRAEPAHERSPQHPGRYSPPLCAPWPRTSAPCGH